MKRNSIISNGISYLFLAVMFYMHLCSALCAAGGIACCESEQSEHCNKKECCSHEKKSEQKEQDCQDIHFSFFNATGQYAFEKSDDALKVFHSLLAVSAPPYTLKPEIEFSNDFDFKDFHPPPPKEDIRIFIQSFQI